METPEEMGLIVYDDPNAEKNQSRIQKVGKTISTLKECWDRNLTKSQKSAVYGAIGGAILVSSGTVATPIVVGGILGYLISKNS